MKASRKLFFSATLCAFVVFAATTKPAHAQNSRALEWFNRGIKENDPDKKIKDYLQALAIDEQFVEAQFNLGLAYRDKQDFENAEKYLAMAAKAKPSRSTDKFRDRVFFELAKVYKINGKVLDCETALLEAKKAATDKGMHARISIDLARVYIQQNRFEDALAELTAGRKLSPENESYFSNFINSIQKSKDVQAKYAEAEREASAGNYIKAKSLFERVREMDPGFENVTARLTEIDSLIEAKVKKDALMAVFEQAKAYDEQGKLELAIATYEKILQQAPNDSDAQNRLQKAQNQFKIAQQAEIVDREYNNGLQALKQRNWTRAILSFEQVIRLNPTYQDAQKRLTEARAGLDEDNQETIITRYYADGVSAMQQNDWNTALIAFEKVRNLNPTYKDVAAMIAKVEKQLDSNVHSSAKSTDILASSTMLDSLYNQALAAIDAQDWMQALVNLEKIRLLNPNFRDTIDLLASTRANMTMAETGHLVKKASSSTSSSFIVIGVVISAVILPLLGFLFFLPTGRARFYLLRGNYAAAAQVYEKLLEQNPGRLKLYPILANIYFLAGRSDAAAMKIYKTVLQLNLNIDRREEIRSLVTKHFLTEGKVSGEAIHVLESALKAEMQRQQLQNNKGN